MTKSLESVSSRENTTVLSTANITFIRNILVFFKIITWTIAVLTNISTIAAVTQGSAVEMCFTTLASVGRTSLLRTATFYQLDYSLRICPQSSHHSHLLSSNFQPKLTGDGSWRWGTMSLFQNIA